MRRYLALAWILCFSACGVSAQKTVFDSVKIRRHRSSEKRVLVDKIGTLTFDDGERKLTFKGYVGYGDAIPDTIQAGYDDVRKVIFDAATRMRGGALAQVVRLAPVAGPMVGTAIAGAHVNDYWFYIEYDDLGQHESALLVVPKDSSSQIIEKAKSVFGSRVTLPDFPEKAAAVKMEDLKAVKSKQELKVDKQNHPLPVVKDDKATVVVVCPPLAARYAGKGNQFKLHANDQIIAVNKEGTYSFAYLDPGKYRLVSQTENASGFDIELEAGHEYFFLQSIFQGVFKAETALTRNSPELVMYLLDGSYYSDWKEKAK